MIADPSSFVNDLFEIIQYRSYIPGAAPPPKTAAATAPPVGLPGLGDPSTSQPFIPAGPGGGGRKRGFQDRDDFDAPTGREQFQGGRQYKQPRRGGGYGGRKGYVDPDRPQPVSQDQYSFQNASGQHAPSFAQPGHILQIPAFDPSNALEAMRQLQQEISRQMGLSMPPYPDYSQQQQPGYQQGTGPQQGRKGRCWDFDRKGFCPRGLKCKFAHSTGTEPAVPYSLPAPQVSGNIPLPGEGRSYSRFPSSPVDSYPLNLVYTNGRV
jgi:RNA-binding protein 26